MWIYSIDSTRPLLSTKFSKTQNLSELVSMSITIHHFKIWDRIVTLKLTYDTSFSVQEHLVEVRKGVTSLGYHRVKQNLMGTSSSLGSDGPSTK